MSFPNTCIRPPPLSKYRRKTANARERTRMSEINEGFEDLKSVIPDLPEGKLTKITTLRLALDYMHALRHLLGYEDADGNEIAQTPATDTDQTAVTSPSESGPSVTVENGQGVVEIVT